MTAVTGVDTALDAGQARLAETFVRWLETGVRSDDLFAQNVFADLTVPHWRVQGLGLDAAYRLREDNHPHPGVVAVRRLDRTTRGFLIEFEERWTAEGQQWYSREMVHCVVAGERISELHIYCCGDWDEALQRRHAQQVQLVRP